MMEGRGRPFAIVLLAAGACACSGARPRSEPPAVPAPSVALDASYDWHGLVTVPFGSLLKESPLPLHEVLLFQEASSPEADNKDCFATDQPPPRFVGQRPDTYLLCFDHDRLNRIEAAVRLAVEEAPQVFARACALWLKTPSPSATVCEGRDGDVAFNAKLALASGDLAGTLTITLSYAAPRT